MEEVKANSFQTRGVGKIKSRFDEEYTPLFTTYEASTNLILVSEQEDVKETVEVKLLV